MKENSELKGAVTIIRKRFWTAKNILRGIACILILAILGGAWFYGYSVAEAKANKIIAEKDKEIAELTDKPVVLDPVTPEIVQKVIDEKISEISELATAEYVFTNAARFENTKHIAVLPDGWTQKSFIQKWDGKIKAGIDLEKVTISIKNKVVTITMPYAKILSYEIDNNSVEILDEKNGLFNKITVKDKVNFDRETEYEMKDRAIKHGLLTKAEDNAEKVISNLIKASVKNIEKYEIKFEKVDE